MLRRIVRVGAAMLLLTFAGGSAGCSSVTSLVKTRAANDLHCPEGGMVVEEFAHNDYYVTGCNQKISYHCAGFGSLANCQKTDVAEHFQEPRANVTATVSGNSVTVKVEREKKPVTNTEVTIKAGDITATGNTDSQGSATIDITALPSAGLDNAEVIVPLPLGRGGYAQFSLKGTPAYAAAEDKRKADKQALREQQEKAKQRNLERMKELGDACKGGSGEACYQLAEFVEMTTKFDMTIGVLERAQTKHELYKAACERKYEPGCKALPASERDVASIVETEREMNASRASRSLLDGVPVAKFKEGCQHRGAPGSMTSCALYQAASKCEQGDQDGCDTLGKMYVNGTVAQSDPAIAKRLWKAACLLDASAESCIGYGVLFASGRGGIPQDAQAGDEFFRSACGKRAENCATIGVMFRDGRGVPRDPGKGAEYLKKACDGGSAAACRLTGGR